MADDEAIDWQPEAIPASDRLFMRVHRMFVKDGDFGFGVFRDHGSGMSTEWEKYTTPYETRNRAKRQQDNGVIQMICGDVTTIAGLTITHTPDIQQRIRAHADVIGEKSPEVRLKLKRISKWVEGFQLD